MTDKAPNSFDRTPLAAAIANACKGLVYVSETDAGIEPFFAEDDGGETAQAILKKEFSGEYAEQDFEQFFARLTADQAWHTPLQKRTVKKFRSLRSLLRSNLTELSVHRFGRIRIEILVVGRDADRNLAGIRTRSVET